MQSSNETTYLHHAASPSCHPFTNAPSWSQGIDAPARVWCPRRSRRMRRQGPGQRPEIGRDAEGGSRQIRRHPPNVHIRAPVPVRPVPGEHISDVACKRCILDCVDGITLVCGVRRFQHTDNPEMVLPGNLPCLPDLRRRTQADRHAQVPVTGFATGVDERGKCMGIFDHLALEVQGVAVEQRQAFR